VSRASNDSGQTEPRNQSKFEAQHQPKGKIFNGDNNADSLSSITSYVTQREAWKPISRQEPCTQINKSQSEAFIIPGATESGAKLADPIKSTRLTSSLTTP
jgi:hypothetical protein